MAQLYVFLILALGIFVSGRAPPPPPSPEPFGEMVPTPTLETYPSIEPFEEIIPTPDEILEQIAPTPDDHPSVYFCEHQTGVDKCGENLLLSKKCKACQTLCGRVMVLWERKEMHGSEAPHACRDHVECLEKYCKVTRTSIETTVTTLEATPGARD